MDIAIYQVRKGMFPSGALGVFKEPYGIEGSLAWQSWLSWEHLIRSIQSQICESVVQSH